MLNSISNKDNKFSGAKVSSPSPRSESPTQLQSIKKLFQRARLFLNLAERRKRKLSALVLKDVAI